MNKIIKIITLSSILLALPVFAADMDFTPKKDITLSGKIATLKTSQKYRSVSSCQQLCESRTSCVAFTLNTNKGTCKILKTVTKETADVDSTSGIKN